MLVTLVDWRVFFLNILWLSNISIENTWKYGSQCLDDLWIDLLKKMVVFPLNLPLNDPFGIFQNGQGNPRDASAPRLSRGAFFLLLVSRFVIQNSALKIGRKKKTPSFKSNHIWIIVWTCLDCYIHTECLKMWEPHGFLRSYTNTGAVWSDGCPNLEILKYSTHNVQNRWQVPSLHCLALLSCLT